MREALGVLAFHCVLVAIGLALLRALGLVALSRRRGVLMLLGPALVVGAVVTILAAIVLTVAGVPVSIAAALAVSGSCAAAALVVSSRRDPRNQRGHGSPPSEAAVGPSGAWLTRAALAAVALYVTFGAFALARVGGGFDDVRIWSLKGLTLYYHGFRPEIFHSPATTLAHPVYPLFQPMFEALLGRAAGASEFRLFHAELWLFVAALIWTAAYLLWWRRSRPSREQVGLVALVFLGVASPLVSGVWSGYADVTGAVLLGVGALSLGLWIDGDDVGCLALASLLLAAAANTKDEDMVGVALVLAAAALVVAVRGNVRRLAPWAAAVTGCVALVAPWRIWTAVHNLSDGVVPPLPRALSPPYVLDRLPQLHKTVSAMLAQVLTQWGWLAAIFLVLCLVSLTVPTTRRLAWFYLASFSLIAVALIWLYTTTPTNLAFLISTSMSRTVGVFMVLAAFASAHLLTGLAAAPRAAPEPRTAGGPATALAATAQRWRSGGRR